MRLRFIIYMLVALIINLVCWYFVVCFCATYPNSSENWMKGIYLGMIIDYLGIKLVIPLIKTSLRQLIKYTQSKLLIKIYQIWVKIMAYMKPKRI